MSDDHCIGALAKSIGLPGADVVRLRQAAVALDVEFELLERADRRALGMSAFRDWLRTVAHALVAIVRELHLGEVNERDNAERRAACAWRVEAERRLIRISEDGQP